MRTSSNLQHAPARGGRGYPVWLNTPSAEPLGPLVDPQSQTDLIGRALREIEQVQQLVHSLDEVEIPGGDRQGMLNELSAAADRLRQLFFVDAIY